MPRQRHKKKKLPEPIQVKIESLSHEGRGIAKVNGKALFVDGALPDEEVEVAYLNQRGKFDEAKVLEVFKPSPDRVEPPCANYQVCGGCSLQHLSNSAQIKHKQSILAEQLNHFAKTQPNEWLSPIQADLLGYRRKARLGVRYVVKKQRTLIGFREKYSNYLADIDSCPILTPSVSQLIQPLSELIDAMQVRQFIPQIEVACGDEKTALIVRHLKPMGSEDRVKWAEFARDHQLIVYLQPKGPDSLQKIWPADESASQLSYQLEEFDLSFEHNPLDFVQVNASINHKMIALAIEMLEISSDDNVLDLFCGLGNFTLAIASRAAYVVGVEVVETMVERAKNNAKLNQLDNVDFYQADLTADLTDKSWNQKHYNKILIDPARSGALEVINNIVKFNAEKIVYVSCNPATLARDTGELVKSGYTLAKAGVLDMFPHTTHVESIALFEKG